MRACVCITGYAVFLFVGDLVYYDMAHNNALTVCDKYHVVTSFTPQKGEFKTRHFTQKIGFYFCMWLHNV